MTIPTLLQELRANNIRDDVCVILPKHVVSEGVLYLCKSENESSWQVLMNERGNFVINKTFYSEHEACRFFLETALLEPTNRKDFTQSLLLQWPSIREQLAQKYGFKEVRR